MNLIKVFKFQVFKLFASLFPSERQKNLKQFINNDGESLRYKYDLNENSIVFDLGGYKGQWASDIYAMYNCQIIVIEPQPVFFERIQERFQKNSKIRVYPFALGKSNRQEFISYEEDASSSFSGHSNNADVMTIEDVHYFFENNSISKVDLMKINIEGGEYELLNRMIETGLIKRVKNIQIQFHDFVPNAKIEMENIHIKLSITHKLTYQYKFVWENWLLK